MAFIPPPTAPAETPANVLPPGWMLVPPPPPPKPGWRQDLRALALLALLALFHVSVNLYWLQADKHLILFDEAHHIQRSVAFHDALFPTEPEGMFARVLAALSLESPYPPLSHLAGAAVIRHFGGSPDAVALTGTFCLVLLLLGLYALARQGMTAHNAFLAALLASFTPMVYGYSRLIMPDTLCGALVVWALYGLVKSDLFRRTGWTVFFGAACGLALLAKQTAFVYLVLPAALALAWGLVRALLKRDAPAGGQAPIRWTAIAFNVVLCSVVIAAVCAWWYLRHLEYLYTWWSTQRPGLLQPGIGARLASLLPAAVESPETRIALDPALSLQGGAVAPAPAGETLPSLFEPYRLFWRRYMIYLVNEALFLPLALTALAGLPALFLKRNRSMLPVLLVAWPAGAYLLLTGMFALHSPRFLYGMAPAAALLAVYALDAIPRLRLRRALWGLLLVFLAVQFINSSIVALGPIRRLELPLLAGNSDVRLGGNTGLTVYKDRIYTGRYIIHPPDPRTPVTETLLAAMTEHEQQRQDPAIPDGAAAWYQVVSPVPAPLGVEFYARQLSLPPTPVAAEPGEGEKADLDEGEGKPDDQGQEEGESVPQEPSLEEAVLTPARSFAAVKGPSLKPEATQPELAETGYVIVYQPLKGPYIASLEESVSYFYAQGFNSLFHSGVEGDRPGMPGMVHVLARREYPQPEEIQDLFALYEMLDLDGKLYLLSDAERATLEARYADKVGRYTPIQALHNGVSLLGFHAEPTVPDWFMIRLVVHVTETPGKDLRVWMRAVVHEEDRASLFDVQREESVLCWDFTPELPATQWRPKQALVLSHSVMARALRYQVEIGLYASGEAERPDTPLTTEWIDFGALE